MTKLIVMVICVLIFGLLLCFLKAFLWWLGRHESNKRRTRIIFSRKFQIQRPISIQLKSQYDSHEGRARISKHSDSNLSTTYGATERTSKVIGSMENMDVTCAICLELYREGQELMILSCGHVYHEACITCWLEEDSICPVCRNSVSGSDLEFVVETLPSSNKSYKKVSYI